jgi:hypothetical protein
VEESDGNNNKNCCPCILWQEGPQDDKIKIVPFYICSHQPILQTWQCGKVYW